MKQIYECILPDVHLYVSVGRGGTKSFCFRCKLGGNWKTLDLKCKFDDALDDALIRPTMQEAQARASEYEARISRGENPFDKTNAAPKERTLKELFDEYIQRHISKNGKHVDEIVKNFDRWFDKLAKGKASLISKHDAERFHGELSSSRGPYAANRAIQLGRAIYNKAKQHHLYFGDNPFSGITLFDEHARDRFLSAEEAAKLIQSLKDVPAVHNDHRTLRDFVLLDMLTGVRKSNLLSMEWSEIDLKARTWTIPPQKAKNKKGQVIPLGPNELAILHERKELLKAAGIISPFVFPGTGKSGHLQDIKRSWTTLRKNLNLTDVTIHDLRRSLAATMASANVNVALIKGAMNHKDMKTTLGVYARTNKQAELEARQIAHAIWFEAVEQLPEQNAVAPISNKSNKSSKR